MGFRVDWSPEAAEDVEAIAEYISRDSGFYARAVVRKILDVSRSLGEFPKIGRIVPEFDDENTRERFVYSYRLVYHIEKERILVVAVIHGKRLVESISERFNEPK
ncbi:MAG: type II toxin-antitoxin system RelE/ParE family toxin [Gammaproteobacteria bacterium]